VRKGKLTLHEIFTRDEKRAEAIEEEEYRGVVCVLEIIMCYERRE
jgi:hypothetical protein